MTPRDEESYESRETLRRDLLADEEFRYGYAESFLNSYVAAQIKTLREQRKMKQSDLAEKIGTKQAGISRLENVNYSAWKTETLRRLARALGVRLRISFETFGTLLDEVESFNREALQREKPEKDRKLLYPAAIPPSISAESSGQSGASVTDVGELSRSWHSGDVASRVVSIVQHERPADTGPIRRAV